MFTKPIRGWVIFAQILGTIISVVALVAVAVEFSAIQNLMTDDLDNDKATIDTILAMILGIICYVIVKQVINMAVIIHACETMDDMELSANRWIISSLSLTVGGFFTPFIMKMFPNVNIQSTVKPKAFLSKVYGYTLAIGGAVFMIVFGAVAGKSLTGTPVAKDITIAFFVISGVFFILGSVLLGLFAFGDANTRYENSTSMKVFANIVTGIVTIELIIMLIWNWMEVMETLSEAFNGRNNGAMALFAMLNFFIQLVYVGFLTQITCETISGLWRNQANYTVFQPLADRESNTSRVSLD